MGRLKKSYTYIHTYIYNHRETSIVRDVKVRTILLLFTKYNNLPSNTQNNPKIRVYHIILNPKTRFIIFLVSITSNQCFFTLL